MSQHSSVIVELIDSPDGVKINVTATGEFRVYEVREIATLAAKFHVKTMQARELVEPLISGPTARLSNEQIEYHFSETQAHLAT